MKSTQKLTLAYDKSIPGVEPLFTHYFRLKSFKSFSELRKDSTDILLCRSTLTLNKLELEQQGDLKIIASATSGLCHINKPECDNRNIQVFSAKGANSPSVCDYVTSVLAHCLLKEGLPIQKIGIIGAGFIGSRLSKRLKLLGFTPLLCDPFKKGEKDFTHTPLSQLKHCDFISLHVPYTKDGKHQTHWLLDSAFLSHLKPNAVIVNTSRGQCINEEAMVASSHLYFCSDVFNNEPILNKALINKLLIATPHIAGHATESKLRLTKSLQQQILKHFNLINNENSLLPPLKECSLEKALSSYDPLIETKLLKEDPSKEGFKRLRKAHTFRHEFD